MEIKKIINILEKDCCDDCGCLGNSVSLKSRFKNYCLKNKCVLAINRRKLINKIKRLK